MADFELLKRIADSLDELLCHFGYHIKHPDFTLSPTQVKRVLQIHERLDTFDEERLDKAEQYAEPSASFKRGYLTGMAFALGTTWQDLLRHAQYLNRNGSPCRVPFPNVKELRNLHGHDGSTEIVKGEPPQHVDKQPDDRYDQYMASTDPEHPDFDDT